MRILTYTIAGSLSLKLYMLVEVLCLKWADPGENAWLKIILFSPLGLLKMDLRLFFFKFKIAIFWLFSTIAQFGCLVSEVNPEKRSILALGGTLIV